MKNWVGKDSIYFKAWSGTWLSYYSATFIFVAIGLLLPVIELLKGKGFSSEIILISLILIFLGFVSALRLHRKLEYNYFIIDGQNDDIKLKITQVLKVEGWQIKHNTKTYIQAVYREQPFKFDMVTIVYNKKSLKFNSIHYPNVRNSFAILLARNSQSKKLLNLLKDCL